MPRFCPNYLPCSSAGRAVNFYEDYYVSTEDKHAGVRSPRFALLSLEAHLDRCEHFRAQGVHYFAEHADGVYQVSQHEERAVAFWKTHQKAIFICRSLLQILPGQYIRLHMLFRNATDLKPSPAHWEA